MSCEDYILDVAGALSLLANPIDQINIAEAQKLPGRLNGHSAICSRQPNREARLRDQFKDSRHFSRDSRDLNFRGEYIFAFDPLVFSFDGNRRQAARALDKS